MMLVFIYKHTQVLDNALSAMKAAGLVKNDQGSGAKIVPCVGHTFQLDIKKLLKQYCSDIVLVCCKITKHFCSSTQAQKTLLGVQTAMGVKRCVFLS